MPLAPRRSSSPASWRPVDRKRAARPARSFRRPVVAERRAELVAEAQVTLQAIAGLARPGVADPMTDVDTLTRAVTTGILDAPHLRNNPFGRGAIVAREDARGAWVAVDPDTSVPLSEQERLSRLSR